MKPINKKYGTATAATLQRVKEKRAIEFVHEQRMTKISAYSKLFFVAALIGAILYNIIAL